MDATLPRPFLARTRFWLAVALTFAVLPYAYGLWLVYFLRGITIWRLPVVVAATVAVLLPLTWGLRPRLRGWGILAGWVVAFAGLVIWAAGPGMPLWQVILVLVSSTLWLVWLGWLSVWPWRWSVRLGLLAVWLVLGVTGPALIRVEGMAGETTRSNPNLVFAWRKFTRPQFTAAADKAVLVPTPHDFPRFLGPNGSGVLPEAKIAGDWTATPPRQLWRRPVGAGWSGFAVVGEYAFTQEQRDDAECVTCYRVKDGEPVWTHADKAHYDGIGGPGPRATPAVADGHVYAVGATGRLNCLDATTGQVQWSKDIQSDNGAARVEHGVCASPLVDGDRVIVCPTGVGGPSLVAYHRVTGARLWQAGTERASYASPLIAEFDGVRQILLATRAGVTGHAAADGQVLWSFEWTNGEYINAAQPIAHAGRPNGVVLATGYGAGAALFDLVHSGDTWTAEGPAWKSLNLKAKFTTPVLYQGHLFGLDDGILTCVDAATGKRRWKDGRYGHGQVLLAGDRLIVQTESGPVVLVEPSPERLIERGRLDGLTDKTWNNPALAGRYLLVRNDREAVCYELP